MDFAEIERARADAGIAQKKLCERSEVNQSTYSQLKKGHRGAYVRTVEKLRKGLVALIAEKDRTDA